MNPLTHIKELRKSGIFSTLLFVISTLMIAVSIINIIIHKHNLLTYVMLGIAIIVLIISQSMVKSVMDKDRIIISNNFNFDNSDFTIKLKILKEDQFFESILKNNYNKDIVTPIAENNIIDGIIFALQQFTHDKSIKITEAPYTGHLDIFIDNSALKNEKELNLHYLIHFEKVNQISINIINKDHI